MGLSWRGPARALWSLGEATQQVVFELGSEAAAAFRLLIVGAFSETVGRLGAGAMADVRPRAAATARMSRR
jgi:hypothetical protein